MQIRDAFARTNTQLASSELTGSLYRLAAVAGSGGSGRDAASPPAFILCLHPQQVSLIDSKMWGLGVLPKSLTQLLLWPHGVRGERHLVLSFPNTLV